MKNDIEGICRSIVGFSKIPDEDGEFRLVVEYDLHDVDLNHLRIIFNVDMSSKDPSILDMINPLDIDDKQALALQKYIKDGVIDICKYNFVLYCWQDPTYDWSEGVPIRK